MRQDEPVSKSFWVTWVGSVTVYIARVDSNRFAQRRSELALSNGPRSLWHGDPHLASDDTFGWLPKIGADTGTLPKSVAAAGSDTDWLLLLNYIRVR